MFRMLLGGAVAGVSYVVTTEYLRVQRGAARSCRSCSAPVGTDGLYRAEREPRSYMLSYSDHPAEWTNKESRIRKMKCNDYASASRNFIRIETRTDKVSTRAGVVYNQEQEGDGCKKPLDITSVIVFDRAWHRNCLVCAKCKKKLTGNRYFMLNNQPYDAKCFKETKQSKKNISKHTIIDYRFPDPSVKMPKPEDRNIVTKRSPVKRTKLPRNNDMVNIFDESFPFVGKSQTASKFGIPTRVGQDLKKEVSRERDNTSKRDED